MIQIEHQFTLVYAVQGLQEAGQTPMAPERVLELLRAMGERTRLQILELLQQHQRSTRELAGLTGLSEAAISKHMRVLRAAGLVVSRRESYYVFYRLVPDPLDELIQGLTRLLGGSIPDDSDAAGMEQPEPPV